MLKQFLTTIFVFATVLASAQSGFEGTIHMETTTAKTEEEAKVVVHVKGQNTRMDFESVTKGHEVDYSVIVDERGVDLVSQGQVTRLDRGTLMPSRGAMKPVLKEGGVEMNGYQCTHYQFSDGDQTIDYWLTDDLGISMEDLPEFFMQPIPKPEGGRIEGLAISMTVTGKDGKTVSTQKVTAVNPSRVDEQLFDR